MRGGERRVDRRITREGRRAHESPTSGALEQPQPEHDQKGGRSYRSHCRKLPGSRLWSVKRSSIEAKRLVSRFRRPDKATFAARSAGSKFCSASGIEAPAFNTSPRDLSSKVTIER